MAKQVVNEIEIIEPDDWHLHLRDGPVLGDLVPWTARVFGRAIVMPNLRPPVATVAEATSYRTRILDAVPAGVTFEPLMTLYLTPNTSTQDIEEAAADPNVHAVKLYPAGATTNAEAGVTDLEALADVLGAMQELNVPLLIHGESTDPGVDVFDREAVFIRDTLRPLLSRFDRLRVVLEHITTADAVDFIEQAPARVAATITAHHLLYDRNALFAGGLRPHMYCLPVLKRSSHRQALLRAATSGHPKFFLGTDSAPHPKGVKESDCGCAGIFTAHAAIGLYAEAFDEMNALPRLEGFAAKHGPEFYGLPLNAGRLRLVREPASVPDELPLGPTSLVPLRAGESVRWTITQ